MTEHRLVVEAVLDKFEDNVNDLLKNGWRVVKIDSKLRIISTEGYEPQARRTLIALLEKETPA